MKLEFFSPAPRPLNEDRRQAAVSALLERGAADPAALQRITAEAGRMLGCPIAAVSIIDGDRQLFLSSSGGSLFETSRAVSFCAHAILSPTEIFCVSDASRDRRFSGNPLVRGEPGIRFYIGVPLCDAEGQALGSLSVIDMHARAIETQYLHTMQRLGRAAIEALL